MSTAEDPWEHHATWWRETFTNGADLEYELQILPLAASHLEGARTGARSRQRRGPARPAPRRRRSRHPRSSSGSSPRPPSSPSAVGHAGGGPRYVRGVGERLPFRDGSLRRDRLLPRHRALRRTPTPFSPRRSGCSPSAGGSSSSSTTRCSRGPGAASSTTRSWASTTGGSGPYLREDVVFEEVDPGCAAAFRPPAAFALREPRHRARLRADPPRGAGAAARVPRGLGRSRARVRHPAAAAAPLRAAGRRARWEDRGRWPSI